MDWVLKERFKFIQVWPDKLDLSDLVNHRLLSLQAMPSDTEDDAFISRDASAFNQFLRARYRHPARSFSENAFGFGQQFDCFNDLLIRAIFGCTAGFLHRPDRIVAVCRSADRQRFGNRLRLGNRLNDLYCS